MPLHQFHDKTGIFNNEKMRIWKEWLGCDHVLKHNEMYLFVETIPEHEFEELPQEEEKPKEIIEDETSN
jgi:hypothetical protein